MKLLFEVWEILAAPGVCAIDFETYPTSPTWHAEQAALAAPHGSKSVAKAEAMLQATMGGRAMQRLPCTLQLHHENGSEIFVRLLDPAIELPMMFDGCVASLVAHNAQFETEILLKHGVSLDIDCTLCAAKALYLTAVPQDAPQPVSFGLADLVSREFGRQRDKTIRDRDWRLVESLDAEAIAYGLQDVRDCLELWQVYRARLAELGLLAGYREIQQAILPTAQSNLTGLLLNQDAHAVLMTRMQQTAADLERKLAAICHGAIDNHGSTQQISTWIMEEILEVPIKPPTDPKLVGLVDFLCSRGGLRPLGELAAMDAPSRLIKLTGMSLEDATIAAWEHGYIGHEHDRFDPDAGRPEAWDLLVEVERELRGDRVLTLEDHGKWDAYLTAKDYFERAHKDDDYRLSNFVMRLTAKTDGAVKGWRTTKTGHLAITKGSKLRKAEQLREAFPAIAEYLVTHERWNKATKLLDAFGPALRRWQDDDGRVRGQFKIWATVTARHSCVNPNLQQMPNEPEFRALWIAPPGRKLIIADYSQIELRLLAIITADERLREVYREGRDVHTETASIAYHVPLDQVTKEQRKAAKAVNFGIAYGSGAAGLAENGGFALEEAHMILARIFGAYPGLAKYREQAPEVAAAKGSIDIRPNRRVLYDRDSPGTTAINYPIQGGAASVQMRALRLIYDALADRPDLDVKLAASVHDEAILDSAEAHAKDAAELLVDCMTRALLAIYPEAEEMGLARLTEAAIVSSWAEKP